jgi:hypothetical protein
VHNHSAGPPPAGTSTRRPRRSPLKILLLATGLAVVAAPIAEATPASASTPSTVTLGTSAPRVALGADIVLTARINAPIDNSTYFVRIADTTRNFAVAQCYSGTVCRARVGSLALVTDTFVAHLDRGRGGPAPYPVVASSTAVQVSWAVPRLTLTRMPEYVRLGQYAWVWATLDTPITGSAYFVRIIDATTGRVLQQCLVGDHCGAPVSFAIPTAHQYVAHLDHGSDHPAPYPIIAATPAQTVRWVTTLPRVTSIPVSLHTTDDQRDADTWLQITVRDRYGRTISSWCSGTNLPFPNNSDHTATLPGNPSTTWDDVRGGSIELTINPTVGICLFYGSHGAGIHDTWRFNLAARVNFSNGRWMWVTHNGVQMSRDRRSINWPINP